LISYEESKDNDSQNTAELEELCQKKEFEQKKKLFVLNHTRPIKKPKSEEQNLISKILKDINKLGLEREQ